jgi:membrane protein DedA with SNARE-associated domain
MHGPAGAYVGLFGLMLLAWAGLPVAGQPALVAAGVLAANKQLSLTTVLLVATAASAIGGCVGYWIGHKGGRKLITMRGPFHERRAHELDRGERLIDRYGPVAVLFAPTWVAGIFDMGWRKFLPWNLIASMVWTLVAGLGGYFFGPPVTNLLSTVNTLVLVSVGVGVVAVGAIYWLRRRRRADAASQPSAE